MRMAKRKAESVSIPGPKELKEKRHQVESERKHSYVEEIKKRLKQGLESSDSEGPIHFGMNWPLRRKPISTEELTNELRQDFAREWNLGYDERVIWLCEPGYELEETPCGRLVPRKIPPSGSTKTQKSKQKLPRPEREGSEEE